MKRVMLVWIAVALVAVIVVSFFIAINYRPRQSAEDGTVYVGVTYCGNSVDEAKQLIDKVKTCTNLFILQSGDLQRNSTPIEQIGDYAVASGLHYMVYLGPGSTAFGSFWPMGYDGRWGSHFLGIYSVDEPGGKMLEGQASLLDDVSHSWMQKLADGSLSGYRIDSDTYVTFMRNGSVKVEAWDNSLPFDYVTYRPDGAVIGTNISFSEVSIIFSDFIVTDRSNLKYTYDELWAAYPIKTASVAEKAYLNSTANSINALRGRYNSTLNVVTADYALHWYDYESGYDAVLAEFTWNQSTTQDIALVRGAANLHGKDWGTIITWKYTEAPYLPNGDEMYQDLVTACRNGAKYIAVFNYAPDMQGPDGILKQEHFDALERFWTDLKDQNLVHAEVKADSAFVLPHGYGSGLRSQSDIVWGLWMANETDSQIYQRMQDALATYGEKLDIVYEDSVYPVTGKYREIIYWNQTG